MDQNKERAFLGLIHNFTNYLVATGTVKEKLAQKIIKDLDSLENFYNGNANNYQYVYDYIKKLKWVLSLSVGE